MEERLVPVDKKYRMWYFAAKSKSEMQDWIARLNASINYEVLSTEAEMRKKENYNIKSEDLELSADELGRG